MIVTSELVPLKERALPYLPVAAHVVFAAVPLLPLAEASLIVVTAPSSNAYAATRPGVAEVAVGASTRRLTTVNPTMTFKEAATQAGSPPRTWRPAPPLISLPSP